MYVCIYAWMGTKYIFLSTCADLHCRYYLAKTLTYTYNTNICLYEDVQSCIYTIPKKKKSLNSVKIPGISQNKRRKNERHEGDEMEKIEEEEEKGYEGCMGQI